MNFIRCKYAQGTSILYSSIKNYLRRDIIYIYLDVMPSVFMYAICLITLLVSLVMDIVAIRFIVLVLRPILRQSLLPLLGTASAMFRK